jgi:hypothetical protein
LTQTGRTRLRCIARPRPSLAPTRWVSTMPRSTVGMTPTA